MNFQRVRCNRIIFEFQQDSRTEALIDALDSNFVRQGISDDEEYTGNLFAPSLTQMDIKNIVTSRAFDDVDILLYIVRNSYAPISVAAAVSYYYRDEYRRKAFLDKADALTLEKSELFAKLAQGLVELVPSGHRYEKERDLALGRLSGHGLQNAITHGDVKLVGHAACQDWYVCYPLVCLRSEFECNRVDDIWSGVQLQLFGPKAFQNLYPQIVFVSVKARLWMFSMSHIIFVGLLLYVVHRGTIGGEFEGSLHLREVVFYLFALSRLGAETGRWYREVGGVRREASRDKEIAQNRQQEMRARADSKGMLRHFAKVTNTVKDGVGGGVNVLKNQVEGFADVLASAADMDNDCIMAGTTRYFRRDPWNAVDLCSSSLLVAAFILRMAEHTTATEVLLVVLIFPSFMRILHVFELQETLGFMVRSLVNMLVDILVFLCFFTVVLGAFTAAFTLLFHDVETPDGDMNYADYGITLQTLFLSAVGEFDVTSHLQPNHPELNAIGTALAVSSIVCNHIVLLNLIIAIMGNTYEQFKETSAEQHKFSRARAILTYADSVRKLELPPPLNLFQVGLRVLLSILAVMGCLTPRGEQRAFRTLSSWLLLPYWAVFMVFVLAQFLLFVVFKLASAIVQVAFKMSCLDWLFESPDGRKPQQRPARQPHNMVSTRSLATQSVSANDDTDAPASSTPAKTCFCCGGSRRPASSSPQQFAHSDSDSDDELDMENELSACQRLLGMKYALGQFRDRLRRMGADMFDDQDADAHKAAALIPRPDPLRKRGQRAQQAVNDADSVSGKEQFSEMLGFTRTAPMTIPEAAPKAVAQHAANKRQRPGSVNPEVQLSSKALSNHAYDELFSVVYMIDEQMIQSRCYDPVRRRVVAKTVEEAAPYNLRGLQSPTASARRQPILEDQELSHSIAAMANDYLDATRYGDDDDTDPASGEVTQALKKLTDKSRHAVPLRIFRRWRDYKSACFIKLSFRKAVCLRIDRLVAALRDKVKDADAVNGDSSLLDGETTGSCTPETVHVGAESQNGDADNSNHCAAAVRQALDDSELLAALKQYLQREHTHAAESSDQILSTTTGSSSAQASTATVVAPLSHSPSGGWASSRGTHEPSLVEKVASPARGDMPPAAASAPIPEARQPDRLPPLNNRNPRISAGLEASRRRLDRLVARTQGSGSRQPPGSPSPGQPSSAQPGP